MTIILVGDGGLAAVNTTTSLPVTLPAGIQSGDVLVAWITGRGTSGTLGAPAGWTAVAAQAGPTTGHYSRAWWKVAGSSETTPTFTCTVAGLMLGSISAFRGCDVASPLTGTASITSNAAAATAAAPSITPAVADAMAVWLFSTADDNTLASPSQGTLGYSYDTTVGSDGSHAMVYELQASASATGTTSVTQTVNGNDNWCLGVLALAPAAADADPSVAWFDGVSVAVEVAFDTDPLAGSPVWTDVTADVLELQTMTGRMSEFEDVPPGSIALRLANADRTYDPEYASGPYYGQLTPMREVRFRARYDSTNYDLWRGFILSWPQEFERGNTWAVCAPSGLDGLYVLANRTLRASALETAVLADGPIGYWPFADESPRVLADASGNGADATPSGRGVQDLASPLLPAAPGGRAMWTETYQAVIAGGIGDASPPETLEFWVRPVTGAEGALNLHVGSSGDIDDRIIVSCYAVDVWGSYNGLVVEYNNTDLNQYGAITGTPLLAVNRTHHVVITNDGTDLQVWLNGELIATDTLGTASGLGSYTGLRISASRPIFGSGATTNRWEIGHVAVYDRTLSSSEVATHYQAGTEASRDEKSGSRVSRILDAAEWPASRRDLSTGVSWLWEWQPDGSTALDELRRVNAAEQGRVFCDGAGVLVFRDREWSRTATVAETSQATLDDADYTDLVVRAADVDMVVNAVSVSSSDGFTIEVKDQTSIDAYLRRGLSLDVDLANPNTAANLGRQVMDEKSSPSLRVEQLTIKPRSAPATLFPIVLGLELGHRVTVQRTPQGVGSAISQELAVEGIAHAVTPDDWTTTLYLAPAPKSEGEGPWLMLGDLLNAGGLLPY